MRILETERLLLRHLEPGDLDELYRLYSDPVMRRFYPEGVLSYAETREELEWFLHGHPRHPELGLWATVHKPDGRFVGRCGLLPWSIEGRAEVEVAYMIDKAFWGQGLATEAGKALVRYGFTTLNLARLICLVTPGNAASVAVARRIGMELEAEQEDEHGPYLLFARAREELFPAAEDGVLALEGRQGQRLLGATDAARDVIEACWSNNARAVLLYAENMPPGFFDLSTRVAGELLQKLQNYQIRLAVVVAPGGATLSSRFGEFLVEGGRDFGVFASRAAARAWLSA